MPKSLPEELIDRIETAYLADETESYASLALRFGVGKSTLERVGKQRNWGRKRDQQKAKRAEKLLKQSAAVSQSLENINLNSLADLDQFNQKRLLKIVQKGLLVFESAIDQNAGNPKTLSALATGLRQLVEIHLKLKPLTITDLVEILIRAEIGPDEFLGHLRQEQQRLGQAKEHTLNLINNY